LGQFFIFYVDKESCQWYNENDKESCQDNLGRDEGKGMPLYNNLKEYRSKLGVNQAQMGALVGTSRQTISQIERGDYSPSVTLALKIAKVCGVTVEDIFSYEEDRNEKEE
jgi:putative transcriptional regulator